MQRFDSDSHDLIRGVQQTDQSLGFTHSCGQAEIEGYWVHILTMTDGYARTIGKNSWMSLEFIERKSKKLANRIADWYRRGMVAESEVFSKL